MDAWWTEQMNGGIGKGEDAHKEVGYIRCGDEYLEQEAEDWTPLEEQVKFKERGRNTNRVAEWEGDMKVAPG